MKYVDWTTSASTVFSPYLLTLHDRYHNQYFQNICSKFDCMNENSYHSRRFLMKSLSSIMRLWVSLLLLSLIGFKTCTNHLKKKEEGFWGSIVHFDMLLSILIISFQFLTCQDFYFLNPLAPVNQIVVPLACMGNGLSNWQSRAHSFATFPNTASCSHLSYDIKHTNKTHGTDKP